jgi:hypothetical protein
VSRQIRISIDDDEVFERLRRRKDALDISWEEALRRGLRDSPEPPRGVPGDGGDGRGSPRASGDHRGHGPNDPPNLAAGPESGHGGPSPFDEDFGEQIARKVFSSVQQSVPGMPEEPLDDEIARLEDAEDAVLVLGDGESEGVPLRVILQTGPDGLDVEVVAVRSGKDTEGMNRFAEGARADVAERFAGGDTVILELADGEEIYRVRPELTWARGEDGTPTVEDVAIREVVFED